MRATTLEEDSEAVEDHLRWLRRHGKEGVARALESIMGTTREDLAPHLGAIVLGKEYVYIALLPEGCKGHRYLLHRMIVDVPSYQRKVLVECLTGPDAGLWFSATEWNFACRYKLADGAEGGDGI